MSNQLVWWSDLSETMTKFDGILKGTGIVVDNFLFQGLKGDLAFFLTHFHTDHTQGLSDGFCRGPIYCSWVTARLLRQSYPRLRNVRALEIGDATIIQLGPESTATVTLLEASHCPGSVMLLLDCELGRFLHTGDFRSDGAELKLSKKVDHLYLDCTFSGSGDFPQRPDVVQQLLHFIQRQDPATCIQINAEMLGTESLLQAVSSHFKAPWFVSHLPRAKQLRLLLTDSSVTNDFKSTRFHVTDKAGPDESGRPVLFIKPGTRWFVKNPSASQAWKKDPSQCLLRDATGVWHLFWAIHSSGSEIKSFVSRVQPTTIIPTCGFYTGQRSPVPVSPNTRPPRDSRGTGLPPDSPNTIPPRESPNTRPPRESPGTRLSRESPDTPVQPRTRIMIDGRRISLKAYNKLTNPDQSLEQAEKKQTDGTSIDDPQRTLISSQQVRYKEVERTAVELSSSTSSKRPPPRLFDGGRRIRRRGNVC